ncbi:MAG: UDP-galactose-lipid carrier transferase [Armatimonadetes bacterium]|nr:UDP-galactose-lipid carrier transferase [Armatimonadota bacterium]
MGRLDQVDLTQKYDNQHDYEKELKHLQLKLLDLEQKLRNSKRSVVIGYEGWDAAGKGGNIKRVIERLDPRGYRVYAIAAPEGEEVRKHYLWRFWERLPEHGQIAIFDRTWYGRVLVERVEKFATKDEWGRAYEEINEFERMLVKDGTIVIKFWIHISKEEQHKRFKEREDSPFKKWKITPEDWRNRDKWDQYLVAAEDMFEKTDTAEAPWNIIAGEYKWWARTSALNVILHALKDL